MLAACTRAFRISLEEMARPSGGPPTRQDTEGHWREAAAYARWAPSPHNTQPWRLRVLNSSRAELYYDPRRLLPKTDPTGAFTSVSLAIFVEYLSLALRPRGYQIHPEYAYKPLDYSSKVPILFATLDKVPFLGEAYLDRSLILQRKTSRLPYDGSPVDNLALKKLDYLACTHGHQFNFSSDQPMVDWTLDLNRFTLFEDLDDFESRTELRQWIRSSDEEAEIKKDGLWYHCLRFPGWLLKSFFDEHEKYRSGWRRYFCGKLLVQGMAGTRTIGWWSGPFEKPEDWARAGHMLATSWLELTRLGFNIHPFGSVITNPKAYALLEKKLGDTAPTGRIWLLTRLGRSEEPPRSHRIEEPGIFLDDKELA